MDALIFDFDGVVVDSEPVHLMGFQRVLQTVGLTLTEADYYTRYLGYDDHDAILVAGRDRGVAFDEARIAELTAAKTRIVQQAFAESIRPLPGAVESSSQPGTSPAASPTPRATASPSGASAPRPGGTSAPTGPSPSKTPPRASTPPAPPA